MAFAFPRLISNQDEKSLHYIVYRYLNIIFEDIRSPFFHWNCMNVWAKNVWLVMKVILTLSTSALILFWKATLEKAPLHCRKHSKDKNVFSEMLQCCTPFSVLKSFVLFLRHYCSFHFNSQHHLSLLKAQWMSLLLVDLFGSVNRKQ